MKRLEKYGTLGQVRMDTRTVPKKCIQKNIYKKKDTINKKE